MIDFKKPLQPLYALIHKAIAEIHEARASENQEDVIMHLDLAVDYLHTLVGISPNKK